MGKGLARSAFTGVGFTTSESEKVVNHPVRRRILLMMMLVGNASIVTVISTFILGFIQLPSSSSGIIRGLFLASGVTLLLDTFNLYAKYMLDCIVFRPAVR